MPPRWVAVPETAHGERRTYIAGCRCPACREANSAYQARRRARPGPTAARRLSSLPARARTAATGAAVTTRGGPAPAAAPAASPSWSRPGRPVVRAVPGPVPLCRNCGTRFDRASVCACGRPDFRPPLEDRGGQPARNSRRRSQERTGPGTGDAADPANEPPSARFCDLCRAQGLRDAGRRYPVAAARAELAGGRAADVCAGHLDTALDRYGAQLLITERYDETAPRLPAARPGGRHEPARAASTAPGRSSAPAWRLIADALNSAIKVLGEPARALGADSDR